jgi:hypothetical protein
MVELKNETNHVVAESRKLSLGEFVGLDIRNRHSATVCFVQSTHDMKESTLPGAGLTDNRDDLSGFNIEIDTLEDMQCPVAFMEIAGSEDAQCVKLWSEIPLCFVRYLTNPLHWIGRRAKNSVRFAYLPECCW